MSGLVNKGHWHSRQILLLGSHISPNIMQSGPGLLAEPYPALTWSWAIGRTPPPCTRLVLTVAAAWGCKAEPCAPHLCPEVCHTRGYYKAGSVGVVVENTLADLATETLKTRRVWRHFVCRKQIQHLNTCRELHVHTSHTVPVPHSERLPSLTLFKLPQPSAELVLGSCLLPQICPANRNMFDRSSPDA